MTDDTTPNPYQSLFEKERTINQHIHQTLNEARAELAALKNQATPPVTEIAPLRAANEVVASGLLARPIALKRICGWTDEQVEENERALNPPESSPDATILLLPPATEAIPGDPLHLAVPLNDGPCEWYIDTGDSDQGRARVSYIKPDPNGPWLRLPWGLTIALTKYFRPDDDHADPSDPAPEPPSDPIHQLGNRDWYMEKRKDGSIKTFYVRHDPDNDWWQLPANLVDYLNRCIAGENVIESKLELFTE